MNQPNKKPIRIKAQLTVNRINKPISTTEAATATPTPTPIAARIKTTATLPSRTLPKLKPSIATTRSSQPILRQQSTSSSSCCSSSSISESTKYQTHHDYNNLNYFRTHSLNPNHQHLSPRLDIPPPQPKLLTPSSSITTTPCHPPPDAYDSARVNRKILDLEISNASLLAINGALERTKVKQQSEIRTLRSQLGGMNESNEGSEGSGSSSTTSTLLNHPVGQHAPSTKDLDEEHQQGELGIDELVAQDVHFAEILKTIDTLILSATRAIHHSPSICPEPPPRHPHPTPAQSPLLNHLKAKVLNPVEIEEKMLRSSLDRRPLHDKYNDP